MRIILSLSLAALTNCVTGKATYQYQRTLPGADGTVYVQGNKIESRAFIFNSTKPVIWNCKLRGEELKCDRELALNIDAQYMQNEITGFEVLSSKDNKYVYRIDAQENTLFSNKPAPGLICAADSKGDLVCK